MVCLERFCFANNEPLIIEESFLAKAIFLGFWQKIMKTNSYRRHLKVNINQDSWQGGTIEGQGRSYLFVWVSNRQSSPVHKTADFEVSGFQSGREDLNLRPLAPHSAANVSTACYSVHCVQK